MPGTHENSVAQTRVAARVGAIAALAATPLAGTMLARVTWDLGRTVARDIATAASPSVVTVSLGDLLAVAAAAMGAALAAHLTLATLLLLVSPRRSRLHRAAVRATPTTWRRLIGTAAAGVLATGMAVPAVASPSTSDAGWVSEPIEQAQRTTAPPVMHPMLPPLTTAGEDSAGSGPSSTDHGATPGENAGPTETQPHSAPSPEAADPTGAGQPYVVSAGDSLWSITADALSGAIGDGESSDDAAAVASAWPELYQENEAAVGADPALIHPGTELVLPEGWAR